MTASGLVIRTFRDGGVWASLLAVTSLLRAGAETLLPAVLGLAVDGVLLALGAALHDRPVHLPFLAAPEQPARTLAGVGDTNTIGR